MPAARPVATARAIAALRRTMDRAVMRGGRLTAATPDTPGSTRVKARVVRTSQAARRAASASFVADGHEQSARTQGTQEPAAQDQAPGARRRAPEARGLHPRVHHHAAQAELRPAEGGSRTADERRRGDG